MIQFAIPVLSRALENLFQQSKMESCHRMQSGLSDLDGFLRKISMDELLELFGVIKKYVNKVKSKHLLMDALAVICLSKRQGIVRISKYFVEER